MVLLSGADETTTGLAISVAVDPEGNPVLVDQTHLADDFKPGRLGSSGHDFHNISQRFNTGVSNGMADT